MGKNHSPVYYTNFLLRIYRCKHPFEVVVKDKKPKTKMGCYIVDKQRIIIYSKFENICPLEEIAIHEYAHHVHETEKRVSENRRKERVHGPEFWRIYSALMAKARINGLYIDNYIDDIIIQ